MDYKAPEHGIALLIANALSSERLLDQALGRVGRYGEPCDRYKLGDLVLVDQLAK